ncbi:MAG: orotate phosphoribosyltransferase [Synergistales bacterium]|nr:orotate phosphoribosyltransferase [Synergistales bacterium]
MNEMESTLYEQLEESGALQRGHFLLASGLHSEYYLQCARFLRFPAYAEAAGRALAGLLRETSPEVVVAPAVGGLIIGHEVARALGVPFLFCEREEGGMRLRRFDPPGGARFVVVEDVMTTGGSVAEVGEHMETLGAQWCGSGCIVRRGRKLRIPHQPAALLELEFPVYQPDTCPLCASGVPVSKPGSRGL